MPDLAPLLTVALLTALPFVALYWVARFVSRRRLGAALRLPRPWQRATLEGWAARGWLALDRLDMLPRELSPGQVLYEWAWVDPDAPRNWRFREAVRPEAPVELLVADLWAELPQPARAASRERLAEAVRTAGEWWGGVERGWNRRPLALRADDCGKKQAGLPLLPLPDLTCAPAPGPLAPALAAEADGPDLILALAALRAASWGFTHPLAPRQGEATSMLAGLSTKVGGDVGGRVGAGLGAALGPIGSMVGRYLGELAGSLGGKAVARQMLPDRLQAALAETETALAKLGELAMDDAFARAAGRPAEAVLEFGKRQEAAREDRSRRLRERCWPTPGQAAVEETLRVALAELAAYRAAGQHFAAAARRAPEAVAGGMVLQNPWLALHLPEGPARLTTARAALNRAARALAARDPA